MSDEPLSKRQKIEIQKIENTELDDKNFKFLSIINVLIIHCCSGLYHHMSGKTFNWQSLTNRNFQFEFIRNPFPIHIIADIHKPLRQVKFERYGKRTTMIVFQTIPDGATVVDGEGNTIAHEGDFLMQFDHPSVPPENLRRDGSVDYLQITGERYQIHNPNKKEGAFIILPFAIGRENFRTLVDTLSHLMTKDLAEG